MHRKTHVLICTHVRVCVYIHMCAHTHITYFRTTTDTLAMADSHWNLDGKLTNWFLMMWQLGFEDQALEVATILELGCGRDICCVKNVSRRVLPPSGRDLPLAGLGPWRFQWREAKPSIPHVRCRAGASTKLVTLHYETRFCFRHVMQKATKSCACK